MSKRDRIMAALANCSRALRPVSEDRFDVILNDETIGYVQRERRQTHTGAYRVMWYPYEPNGRAVGPWNAYVDQFNAGRALSWDHLRRAV